MNKISILSPLFFLFSIFQVNSQTMTNQNKIQNKMKVEIWSDVMCPFCYIGKKNYEKAIAEFSEAKHIEIIWKSFQLDPTIPEDKVTENSVEYLSKRKGIPADQVEKMHRQITATGKKAGIDFNFENSVVSNSFKAHRIMKIAKEKGLSHQAEEAFFKAHFTDGKDLNDKSTLLSIAQSFGLTEKDVEKALTETHYGQAVKADIVEAQQLSIQGVPFFVFDRKYAVSGAQAPETFLQTLETAYKEWREENPISPFKTVIEGQSCDTQGKCE